MHVNVEPIDSLSTNNCCTVVTCRIRFGFTESVHDLDYMGDEVVGPVLKGLQHIPFDCYGTISERVFSLSVAVRMDYFLKIVL